MFEPPILQYSIAEQKNENNYCNLNIQQNADGGY